MFACLDVTIKHLAGRYPVPLVVGVRYLVHCLLMLVYLLPRERRSMLATQRTGLVIARAVCLMGVSVFMALALQRMPVAEATSIQFLAPMLVVLLARPMLGERIGLARWLSVLTGFCGVLLVVRPGGAVDLTGLAFVLCSVLCGASYQLLSRILARTEGAVAMLFYSAFAGSVCFGSLLPWYFRGPAPDGMTILLFASMGLTGGLGHLFFTLAYRDAPASLLAPLNYLQLLWAGLLGWLVFGHLPDLFSAVGMAIVAASGVLVAIQSRLQRAASVTS